MAAICMVLLRCLTVKEASWSDCLENKHIFLISQDISKARSLIDTAEGLLLYLKESEIRRSNANYIFEGYYSSFIELLHALLLIMGYKVSNHLCLGYYIRDVLGVNSFFRGFDDCRKKRKALFYYGKRMDFSTAKLTIERCIDSIEKTKMLLKDFRNKSKKI